MKLATFCDRMDDILDTAAFADIDGSPNGLQVGSRDGDIATAAFAVDAAEATITEAIAADADLLACHHGLWWEGTERLTGRTFDRVKELIAHDIALYVSHLPLDAHPEYGNAAGLGTAVGVNDLRAFGAYEGLTVGQCGQLPSPIPFDAFVDRVETTVQPAAVRSFAFGPDDVSDVAIVTGAGVDWLDEAVRNGADVLLTGEGKQRMYHEAREAGINVVLAGHYGTETFGVRSLADEAASWSLETTYIDHPTRL